LGRDIKNAARKVLEKNDRRSGDYVYFAADAQKSTFQYYWDSCAQAIVMSLFDGRRAEEEMYTLLSTQFPDGCMLYFTSWEAYGRTGNKAFLDKIIPELAREADYMGVQRGLLDDGLVVIVNALEAGTNEGPVNDEITGLPGPRGLGPIMHLLFYVKISHRNGFREFYNSHSGKGYGVKDCGMATLAADMLERTGG